jgi:hypothetical protein
MAREHGLLFQIVTFLILKTLVSLWQTGLRYVMYFIQSLRLVRKLFILAGTMNLRPICVAIRHYRTNQRNYHSKTVIMGSMGGVAVGALASHLCWPWFYSWTEGHMWVELFVGSLPCFEGFLRVLLFFLRPQKSTLLNSNLDSVDEEPLCGNAIANCYLFIIYFIY